MSQEFMTPNGAPQPRAGQAVVADLLADLARRCEAAAQADEGDCLDAAIALISAWRQPIASDVTPEQIVRARAFCTARAWESAALALVPAAAQVTCGRLGDAKVIAQVVLPEGSGAHSRSGRQLAMAVVAALLLALAARSRALSAEQQG